MLIALTIIDIDNTYITITNVENVCASFLYRLCLLALWHERKTIKQNKRGTDTAQGNRYCSRLSPMSSLNRQQAFF